MDQARGLTGHLLTAPTDPLKQIKEAVIYIFFLQWDENIDSNLVSVH